MTENITNRLDQRKTTFETKIKPMLTYVGTIGAIMSAIAYIVLVCVLIFGFKAQSLTQTITFAIANGVAGVVIMQFLKIQGISFAKNIDANKEVLLEYYNTKTKDKKTHSINYYWTTSIIKDIGLKALSIMLMTTCVIYIVIEGNRNYLLLAMAIVNLLMFMCFGLLSLSSAYDFYNEQQIPYIKERLAEYYAEREKALKEAEEVFEPLPQLEIPDMFPDTVDDN